MRRRLVAEASGRNDLVQRSGLQAKDETDIILAGQHFVFDRQQDGSERVVLSHKVLVLL